MALNIANPIVEQKAIEASKITETNKTATVEIALDFFLAQNPANKPMDKQDEKEEIKKLLNEIIALPVINERPVSKPLEYDENGLPV